MSKPSRDQRDRRRAVGPRRSSTFSISGVLRSATVAERQRHRRARRVLRRDADVEQRRRGVLAAGDGQRARPAAAPRSSSWKPGFVVGELQRLDEIASDATRS